MTDPALLPATALAELFRRRALSPVEALAAIEARIARLNPRLNALVVRWEGAAEAARASAARWASGTPLSPLDGVPFHVKDNIPVAGLPCAWGSPLFASYVPERDELPVARLRAAGLVLLGKTNVPEFTLQGYTDNTVYGATRNPWNLALTPGGSSGGAVAAVAAGLGPLALGTDGGGSIRRPCSHAGLVGLKPTPGRIARCDGLPSILMGCEQIGPIARTTADLLAVTALLATPDARDPASPSLPAFAPPTPLPRLRIRFVPAYGSNPVDPEIAASTAALAALLARLGHAVEQGPPPFDAEAMATIFGTIGQAGLAWLLDGMPGKPSPTAPALQEMAEAGRRMPASALVAALDARAAHRRAMAEFFTTTDVILTPAAAALPWPCTESHPPAIAGQPVGPRGHAVFTGFANLAGLPGIAVPAAPSAKGLPIGVQLVGAEGSDAMLCALAAEIEQAQPWADRWPAL